MIREVRHPRERFAIHDPKNRETGRDRNVALRHADVFGRSRAVVHARNERMACRYVRCVRIVRREFDSGEGVRVRPSLCKRSHGINVKFYSDLNPLADS